ncbi:hypothetical protein GQ55_4G368900 [Panicum hallii var. hallii]|uniref:Uncharacterized protein n=1 Tax=Panicum hallii var. hallii TaxID=1504633 RepID=A0A2T7E424_9POAL|nr:hypothetical protein GQ55_4G368900 [Panicum hallii var. hallii]
MIPPLLTSSPAPFGPRAVQHLPHELSLAYDDEEIRSRRRILADEAQRKEWGVSVKFSLIISEANVPGVQC